MPPLKTQCFPMVFERSPCRIPGRQNSPAAASKFAVYGMVESIARQLHGSGSKIAISILCPGVVDTPLTNPNANNQPDWLKPETVAASALHIATAPPNVNVFNLTVFGMKDKPW